MKTERAEDDEERHTLGEQRCLESASEYGAEEDAQRAEKQGDGAQDGDQGDDLVGLNTAERPRRGEERDTYGQEQEAEHERGEHLAEHDSGRPGPLQQQQIQRAAFALAGKRRGRHGWRNDGRGQDHAQTDRAEQKDRSVRHKQVRGRGGRRREQRRGGVGVWRQDQHAEQKDQQRHEQDEQREGRERQPTAQPRLELLDDQRADQRHRARSAGIRNSARRAGQPARKTDRIIAAARRGRDARAPRRASAARRRSGPGCTQRGSTEAASWPEPPRRR